MTRTVHADFSERFSLALAQAGFGDYQLKELGRLFEVSPQAVKKWLDGEAMPVSKRSSHIAALLGVRRSWLIDNEEPMRALETTLKEAGKVYKSKADSISISSEEFKLLKQYRALPKSLQHSLSDLADKMSSELRKGSKNNHLKSKE